MDVLHELTNLPTTHALLAFSFLWICETMENIPKTLRYIGKPQRFGKGVEGTDQQIMFRISDFTQHILH